MQSGLKLVQKILLILSVNLFRLIPFPLLYAISNGLYYLLYYVFRIRRSTVRKNLLFAFPNKSRKEIINIEQKAYRHFCDVILETVKGYTLSPKDMAKRYEVTNPELGDAFYDNKRSVIAFVGHYTNWEWGVSLQQHVKHKAFYIYKQLHNRVVDAYVREKRETSGATLVHKEQMARTVLKNRRQSCLYVLIADQRPSGDQETRTVDFLGRETPCFAGPELMAKTFNFPVVYCKIERVKRGFYKATGILVSDNPKDTAEGEITQKCMKQLELQILEDPAPWMWMHRRWKHQMNAVKATANTNLETST